MSVFAPRLKWLRESKSMTQKDVAEKISISQQFYGRFEKGTGQPNIETLVKLPEILGESLDFILGATDETKQIIDLKLAVTHFTDVINRAKLQLDMSENMIKSFSGEDLEKRFKEIFREREAYTDMIKRNEIYLEDAQKKLAALIAEVPMNK